MPDDRADHGLGPLTDPRSLGSSLGLHALLLFLASIAALGVAIPVGEAPPRVLHAEVGPVDNRAPAVAGGGGPGELGGENQFEAVPLSAERQSAATALSRDPAEALLSDVLSSPTPAT